MYCSHCGTQVSSGAEFCAGCGAKTPSPDLYCRDCGAKLGRGGEFCASCGAARKETSVDKARQGEARRWSPKHLVALLGEMKRSTKIAIAGVLIAALVVGLVFAFLPKGSRTPGVTGTFELGPATQIAGATVGAEGGTIQVQSVTSQLNGMTITVPPGAYAEPVEFIVSERAIVSSTFGEDFTSVTPLITVDNGEVFAAQSLEVTIPIHINDDEFAMGFYYDDETGTLDGIPFAGLTNDSITLVTNHFSDIAIERANSGRILEWAKDGIDSGFRPGKDDFSWDNDGSIIAPGGHCLGQNIAEIFYYGEVKARDNGVELNGRYDIDNDGFEPATPQVWKDDARAYRLCSVLQRTYEVSPSSSLGQYYNFMKQKEDLKSFFAIAYAMEASGEPQLVNVFVKDNDRVGHSLIAYKIEGDKILVADPNYTGESDRHIILERHDALVDTGATHFLPYYSAPKANVSSATAYEWITYWGRYSVVDYETVSNYWHMVLNGNDPGSGYFPADLQIRVCQGVTEDPVSGATAPDEADISDGLVLTKTMLDTIELDAGGRLYWAYDPPVGVQAKVEVYLNGAPAKMVSSPSGKLPDRYQQYLALEPGKNNVGFAYSVGDPSGDLYVNFYRYTIYYDNGTTEVTEAPVKDEAASFEGTWQFYTSQLLRVQGSEETMNYVNTLFSTYGGQPTFTDGPAYASLGDYISQMNAWYVRELIPVEDQSLVIERRADGGYRADYFSSFPGSPDVFQISFEDVQVSGETIRLSRQADSGKFGFELSWEGEVLSGTRVEDFYHPYASFDLTWVQTDDPDQAWAGGYGSQSSQPAGYDAEEVWSCELVKAGD